MTIDIEDLLNDPERFMLGRLNGASHQVLHVCFQGRDYVVKKPYTSFIDWFTQKYYTLQDYFFVGGRIETFPEYRLEKEAQKLQQANGQNMPRLIAHRDALLVREHIYGHTIHHFPGRRQREDAVLRGIYALSSLHQRGIIVGDSHVKNMLIGEEDDQAYWLPSGAYDESDFVSASARDILKLIYSTYTATKDSEIAYATAERMAEHYGDKTTRQRASEILSSIHFGPGLWFSTRIRHESIHRMIKDILSD